MRAKVLPGTLAFGNLSALRRDPLGTLMDAFRRCGDVSRLRLGFRHVHLLAHPAHLQHVLQDRASSYAKLFRVYRKMKIVLGEGLVTSNGEFWKRQRRLAQPAFHRQSLTGLASTMSRLAAEAAERLASRRGEVIDVHAEMLHLSLRILSETMFGVDAGEHAEEVGAAIGESSLQLNQRMLEVIDLPLWLPTPRNRRLAAAVAALDAAVYWLIDRRRKSGEQRRDLLGLLLAAGDEMTDRQLRDELVTLFVAGQETVACALAWSWHLLSENPAAADALHGELTSVLGGRPPSLDDLKRLPYARAVIDEALRLYPPLWLLNRTALEDDEIGGFRIRKGSHVFFSPYVTHRHPDFWTDPDAFRPERFFNEPPRFAYLPFSAGPRQCIGNQYALMEAQLVLATLAQRVTFTGTTKVTPEAAVTLRPRGGLPMRVGV